MTNNDYALTEFQQLNFQRLFANNLPSVEEKSKMMKDKNTERFDEIEATFRNEQINKSMIDIRSYEGGEMLDAKAHFLDKVTLTPRDIDSDSKVLYSMAVSPLL